MPLVMTDGGVIGPVSLVTSLPPLAALVTAGGDNLLLEDGDDVLLEDGDMLLLE